MKKFKKVSCDTKFGILEGQVIHEEKQTYTVEFCLNLKNIDRPRLILSKQVCTEIQD